MQTGNNSVIQTYGLTKTYKGTNALQNLDPQVPQNSICGFLGPNGAGKSTTIKLLLGLTLPTGGSAKVFGMDSVRESVVIRQRFGYLVHPRPALLRSHDRPGGIALHRFGLQLALDVIWALILLMAAPRFMNAPLNYLFYFAPDIFWLTIAVVTIPLVEIFSKDYWRRVHFEPPNPRA